MEDKLGEIRAYIHEYEEHKEALENGQPFERRLTAKKMGSKSGSGPRGKKRKNTRGDKKSAKRRRASDSDFEDDDDDFIDDESDSSESELEGNGSGSEDEGSNASGSEASDKESDGEEPEDQINVDEEVTVESLEEKIKEAKEAIKAGRTQLSEYRKQKKEANDKLATLKKKQMKVQRDKNAFCSLRRSEVRASCPLSLITTLIARAVLSYGLEG